MLKANKVTSVSKDLLDLLVAKETKVIKVNRAMLDLLEVLDSKATKVFKEIRVK